METIEIIYQDKIITIGYTLQGDSNQKNTILYLHGLGCSKSDFFDTLRGTPLLHDFGLLALDLPGHGNSSYPERYYMEDLVEIIYLVLKKLKINKVIVIGHSMGGLIGLLFSSKYSEKVQAFVNIEGNLAESDCFFSRQVATMDFETFDKEKFSEFITKLRSTNNIGFVAYANTLESYSPVQAFYDYSISLVQYSDSGLLLDMFLSLKMPRIFIYGSNNDWLPYIPQLTEQSQAAMISQSDHFPQYDNPIEFYETISRFLQQTLTK